MGAKLGASNSLNRDGGGSAMGVAAHSSPATHSRASNHDRPGWAWPMGRRASDGWDLRLVELRAGFARVSFFFFLLGVLLLG